jgi:hypothetical protein
MWYVCLNGYIGTTTTTATTKAPANKTSKQAADVPISSTKKVVYSSVVQKKDEPVLKGTRRI